MANRKSLTCELCVIGGGMSGIAAAIAAARLGTKVVLIQDRNVLGGNASEEIRMWIRGAGLNHPDCKEGGIIEELALDNMYYNPTMNFSVWSGVLYNKVIAEKNITLLLGTSVCGATEHDGRITSVLAWNLQTYTYVRVRAKVFADCSGDCVIAHFTDAKTMRGREAASEYGEPYTVSERDEKTMGNSVLLQVTPRTPLPEHHPFPFEDRGRMAAQIRSRLGEPEHISSQNYWWLESGGEEDTVKDAAKINRDMLSAAYTTYTELRKTGDNTLTLDWIGSLAGKRESYRYVGKYVLNANDLLQSTPFEDEVAYGGWAMDDHDPAGIFAKRANHTFPVDPYSIPLRSLVSENVANLFFAGRNISATHMALSSTRVMATCALCGAGVGTAAHFACLHGTDAHGSLAYIDEIRAALLDADYYLLHHGRANTLAGGQTVSERERTGTETRFTLRAGEEKRYDFAPRTVRAVRLVFDSHFARTHLEGLNSRVYPMEFYTGFGYRISPPPTLPSAFTLILKLADGTEKDIRVKENHLRLVTLPVRAEISSVTLRVDRTFGAAAGVFSVDILD